MGVTRTGKKKRDEDKGKKSKLYASPSKIIMLSLIFLKISSTPTMTHVTSVCILSDQFPHSQKTRQANYY